MEEERPYRTKAPTEIRGGAFTGSISLQKLTAAFYSLYETMKEEEERVMPGEEVSLEDGMRDLRDGLAAGPLDLISYFKKQKTRIRLAVSLLALLELVRLGEARLRDTAAGLVIERGAA